MQRYNVQQGQVVMRVEKNPLVPNSLIRRTVASVLASTEESTVVTYALDALTVAREKIPILHRDARQHRTFAKRYDDAINFEVLSSPWW